MEKVKKVLRLQGVWIATDNCPGVVVLVSMGGKVYSTTIDKELDPARFFKTVKFEGPYPKKNLAAAGGKSANRTPVKRFDTEHRNKSKV